MTLRLVEPLEKELEDRHATELNSNLEVKLIPVLAAMEEKGILLDKAFFAAFSKELQAQLERLEKQIYDYVGESFQY